MRIRDGIAHFIPEAFHCHEQEHLVTVTQFLSYLTEISHFKRLNLAGQKTRKIPNPDCEGKHLSEANTTLILRVRVRKQATGPSIAASCDPQVTP